MYPMDFEEFLWALNNETLMPLIRMNFQKKHEMGQMMHRMAMDYFRQYLIVGGMPQAVAKFVETRDFNKVDRVKRQILTLYRNDIQKFSQERHGSPHVQSLPVAVPMRYTQYNELSSPQPTHPLTYLDN